MFEVLDRDGLARIGRFPTPHGTVETPVLLPVLHPLRSRSVVDGPELWSRWGVRALITSSYILYRDARLREEAVAHGIHHVTGFPGTIMTDSGAFQQHAYGHVEVSPPEILGFQDRIGSDVATVLDEFIEPDAPRASATRGVEETIRRSEAARALRGASLLAVPVQGGLFPQLRERSALAASGLGDILAVGGIVPLLERYRFRELVEVLAATRPHLAPEKPVHLFGMGHPMLFALGALFGGDLFDSSSYHKFARRESLLFPEGTVPLAALREEVCGCTLCAERPLLSLARLPLPERVEHLTRHNLLQCLLEMRRVRQAIREGTLWELVERRATGHPALWAALGETYRHPEVFLPTEPWSRRTFRPIFPASFSRPSVVRFRRALAEYREGFSESRVGPLRALSPAGLATAPALENGPDGPLWEAPTPLGPVPLELTEIYPAGVLLGYPDDWEGLPQEDVHGSADPRTSPIPPSPPGPAEGEANAQRWGQRQVRAILQWTWGQAAARALLEMGLVPQYSRATGRLRQIRHGNVVLFVVGNDGLPRPTFQGGRALSGVLPPPSGRVVAHPDAAPFVGQGRSLFARHVTDRDPRIVPSFPVLVVDGSDALLGVGVSLLAAHEMTRFTRGVAVRVTAHPSGRSGGSSGAAEPRGGEEGDGETDIGK